MNSGIAEMTVIAVCRELQNSQKTSPENMQAYSPASGGNPTSEVSPMFAGSSYAASVMPAERSAHSQSLW